MGDPTYVLYVLCVGVCICVCGDKWDKGVVGDRELKTSMYCVWLCADGGGDHGI